MSIPTPNQTETSLEDPKHEKTNFSDLILDRYKDTIISLPNSKCWSTKHMYHYQGFWYFSEGLISIGMVIASQDTFQADPNDIYIATQPKSGTTWIKSLTFAVVNRTKYKFNNSLSTHPLLNSNPHDCVPFMEREILKTRPTYADLSSPRLFATHIPYTSLPQSIICSSCHIVYVCRNPKDVMVSLFHHVKKVIDTQVTIEEIFEMFSKGATPCGPYWDHAKSYYKASLQHPTRILFLTYENMINDTESNLKRLAEFLGYPFNKEEEASGVVQEIVKLCSFENLSEVNKHGYTEMGAPNNVFFREGKVGDWSNYITSEMSMVLDQITKEKFHGLDISF